MKRTNSPIVLNQNLYTKSFSIPYPLMALSLFSPRESFIINEIIRQSFKDEEGCTLSNEILAKQHRCSKPTVSIAISKAIWLGMLQSREDQIDKHLNDDGSVSITQRRRLKLGIPEIWEFFGEVWNEFYNNTCPEAETMLNWLDERLANEWKLGKKSLDSTLFMVDFQQYVHSKKLFKKVAFDSITMIPHFIHAGEEGGEK